LKFNITKLVVTDGIVEHWGEYNGAERFTVGDDVSLVIDREFRSLNARLHSAGHLLDVAMKRIKPDLVPSKGYHFEAGPWVQYKGSLDASERDSVREQLENEINKLIQEDIPVVVTMEGDVRTVTFKGSEGCLCGGTHVSSSKDLGTVTITKIQKVKDEIKVKYQVL
jgi:Ser-tRNA(Ala) deacylase AlaX